MNRKMVYTGFALIIIGIAALLIFPYYIYTPATYIISEKYKDGDTLIVYGTITNIRYSKTFNATMITLDGYLNVYLEGKSTNYSIGEKVFMQIKKVSEIKVGNFELSYWMSEDSEIHPVAFWEHVFIATEILGVLIGLIGASIRTAS